MDKKCWGKNESGQILEMRELIENTKTDIEIEQGVPSSGKVGLPVDIDNNLNNQNRIIFEPPVDID